MDEWGGWVGGEGRARFRENRSIFNTPNPRLMNASLFKDSKLLSPARGDRRGSRASVRVPSRAPSVTSVNAAARSPNGSLAKGIREVLRLLLSGRKAWQCNVGRVCHWICRSRARRSGCNQDPKSWQGPKEEVRDHCRHRDRRLEGYKIWSPARGTCPNAFNTKRTNVFSNGAERVLKKIISDVLKGVIYKGLAFSRAAAASTNIQR
ncbi:hypothetical protein Hamer_G024754 [Homarus americanus]|uniref:Uncharacterized protein n=1 Tax=Homarus americanus TaxID=6706 RepID=A0A8J5MQZ4_HOMAM|nr:hypothetical protein Hamer_G024754 [Homarus americanus]